MLAYTSSASILESDLAQSAVKNASTAFVKGIQLRGAGSAIHFNMLEMDVNQKVSIVGVEVSGSGCASFDKAAVADPSRPVIEVCGEFLKCLWCFCVQVTKLSNSISRMGIGITGQNIKVTVFLIHECKDYKDSYFYQT